MSESFHTYPHTKIREALIAYGFKSSDIMMPDGEYVLATAKSVMRFGSNLQSLLANLGVDYVEEGFDCDDFTLLAAALLKLTHRKFKPIRYAVACGMCFGFNETYGHAVVIAVHPPASPDSSELVITLYEPQPTPLCLAPYPKFSAPFWCYL